MNRWPHILRSGPVLAILFVALVLLLYGEFLGLSHLGHDSYPIIIAARITAPADFISNFTEELMDGRYPTGHFYRPGLNYSFALDHMIYGTRPWGYHLTDLLLCAAAAVLMAMLVPALAGRPFALAGISAALFFLIHPVQLNVLPVAPRRGDTLAALFTLAAIYWTVRPGIRLRSFGAALLTLAAVSCKETGALAPILVFTWQLLKRSDEEASPLPSRFRSALLMSLPSLLVVAIFIAVRYAVIGGGGGHGELTPASLWQLALLILPEFLRGTFYPVPFLTDILGWPRGVYAVIALFLVSAAVLLRRRSDRPIAILAAVWFFLGWAIHGLSGSISPWYALHTVIPMSLLFGMLIGRGIETALHSRWTARAPAILLTLLLILYFGVHLRSVPPLAFHPEWDDLSRLTKKYLVDLEEKIESTPNGQTVIAPGMPYGLRRREGSPIVIAAGITSYSVQAWADLKYPDRPIRVCFQKDRPPKTDPGELLVVVSVEVGR